MKLFSATIIFTLFAISVTAQVEIEKVNPKKKNTLFFPKNTTEFLLDSIYDYDAYNSPFPEWHTLTKDLVTERTSNGLPLVFIQYRTNYSSNTDDTLYMMQYDYPNINDSLHYSVISAIKDILSHEWGSYRKRIFTSENEYEAIIDQYLNNDQWVNERKKLSRSINDGNFSIDYIWNDIHHTWVYDCRTIGQINIDSSYYFFTSEYFRDQVWRVSYRAEIWYNSFGTDTLQIEQRTNGVELINNRKIRSIYDENDYLRSRLVYNWDNELNKWLNDYRYDYEVDSNLNFVLKISYGGIDSSWRPTYKEESEYNPEHQKISLLRSIYHIETNDWHLQTKYNREYENGLIIFSKMWAWIDNAWQESQETGYEYDDLGRLSYKYCNSPNHPKDKTEYEYVATDVYQSYSWHRQTYNQEDSIWMNYEKNIEFRNKHITKLDELPINTFKLFPNPCTDYLIIESEVYHSQNTKYEILDMQGRIIDSNQLSPNGRVRVNHLQNGVYFIRVFSPDGKALTLEFVKQ